MKRLFSLILCLALLTGGLVGTTALAEAAAPETVQIQIISTSDGHGKFLPFDYALNAPDTSGSLSQTSSAFSVRSVSSFSTV